MTAVAEGDDGGVDTRCRIFMLRDKESCGRRFMNRSTSADISQPHELLCGAEKSSSCYRPKRSVIARKTASAADRQFEVSGRVAPQGGVHLTDVSSGDIPLAPSAMAASCLASVIVDNNFQDVVSCRRFPSRISLCLDTMFAPTSTTDVPTDTQLVEKKKKNNRPHRLPFFPIFSTFSTDILHLIFSFMPLRHLLNVVSLSCTAAAQLVDDEGLWRRLCIRDFAASEAAAQITKLRYFESVERKSFGNYSSDHGYLTSAHRNRRPSDVSVHCRLWRPLYIHQMRCRVLYPSETSYVSNAFLEMEAAERAAAVASTLGAHSRAVVGLSSQIPPKLRKSGGLEISPLRNKSPEGVSLVCGQGLMKSCGSLENEGIRDVLHSGKRNCAGLDTLRFASDDQTAQQLSNCCITVDPKKVKVDSECVDRMFGDADQLFSTHDCVKSKCQFNVLPGTEKDAYVCKSTGVMHFCGSRCDRMVRQFDLDPFGGGGSSYFVCPISGQILGWRSPIPASSNDCLEECGEEDDINATEGGGDFMESTYSRRNPLRP